jgi:Zn-dependent protease with chaperone function
MRFVTRSLLILLALYGLVFAIVDAYLSDAGAPLWLALLFAVLFIGLQYLAAPWIVGWLMHIRWDLPLPAANREFVERLCAERHLKVPRLGMIESGTPNAFSFGHVPADARVVVTTGLLDVLEPEEANAVLAHEIGHVEHWDFAVMTIAALAPLILYQLYVFTRRNRRGSAIAYSAYLCYLVSQFIVLLLNRTREYFADHYSAEVTHAPDALSSALIKIAYGMVRAEGKYGEAVAGASGKEKARLQRSHSMVGSLALMGISNVRSGAALALGHANSSDAAAVMRWDLVNPWARVYELSSTHPLTALRVRALNRDAAALHQAPRYALPLDQRIEWGSFPLEAILWALPWLSCAALVSAFVLRRWLGLHGIEVTVGIPPGLLMLAGASWILRTWYRYHGEYQPATIGRLIEDVEVSEMRPRAVRLEGEILGRGVPGAFWSPDLVLRDASGILFVLYRQSIPFARLLFAVAAAEKYVGQKVVIEGWFRRGLRPYVEMATLTGEDGRTRRAWSRWVQYAFAAAVVGAGWLWLVAG